MEKTKSRDKARFDARKMREEQNIFARLPATYAASRSQSLHFLKRAGGLSVLEWRTLWDLHEVGPMTIRDLATMQRTDHSLYSRAVPAMVRKGYVTTRRDAEDGRQTIVELTPEGQAAYERAAPVMKTRRDALRAVFSEEEIASFVGYIDRLEEFLRQPVDDFFDKDPFE